MAKRTNEWILETAGVSRSLLASVKEMKLAYYGHTLRKKGDCLEKELIQGTTPGSCTRGRPKMTWIDNIKSWTGSVAIDRTSKECGRQTSMEKDCSWCGQPSNPRSKDYARAAKGRQAGRRTQYTVLCTLRVGN